MKRRLLFVPAGLAGLLVFCGFAFAQLDGQPIGCHQAPPIAGTCSGDFGTEVHFVDTPTDAAKQAKKEQKLVFVLHVSGHFEDPQFT